MFASPTHFSHSTYLTLSSSLPAPQVHLKLGLWRRSLTEELSEASIASIMANLRAATEHGPAWGKVRFGGGAAGVSNSNREAAAEPGCEAMDSRPAVAF